MADVRSARPKSRAKSWLVRADPELNVDLPFHKHCDRHARFAYINSLFFLASTDGPEGLYPHDHLLAEFGRQAAGVASQLLGFGVWEDRKSGYLVHPYCGWRIIPERRTAIPRAVRRAVFARDNHCCVKCFATEDLALDHIYPWSLGGADTVENLQVLCRSCNSSKGARV